MTYARLDSLEVELFRYLNCVHTNDLWYIKWLEIEQFHN